jgi:hypothetical protein
VIELLLAGFRVAESALNLVGTAKAQKFISELHELRREIAEEQEKGQLSDDLKIQRLQTRAKIALDAVNQEIQLAYAKKK